MISITPQHSSTVEYGSAISAAATSTFTLIVRVNCAIAPVDMFGSGETPISDHVFTHLTVPAYANMTDPDSTALYYW